MNSRHGGAVSMNSLRCCLSNETINNKQMNNKNVFRPLLVWAMLSFAGLTAGQPPRGPLVISPQVNPDKTIVFRYLAPSANDVRLSAQFEKEPVAMTKDTIGIWSVKAGPVKPDIYPYSFLVDGIQVMDPGNVAYFPNEFFKASLVDIPGDTPLIHSLQDVPHGTVTYTMFKSKIMKGIDRPLVVYTPPGYESNPDRKYPVLYLISGTTDTEETWYKSTLILIRYAKKAVKRIDPRPRLLLRLLRGEVVAVHPGDDGRGITLRRTPLVDSWWGRTSRIIYVAVGTSLAIADPSSGSPPGSVGREPAAEEAAIVDAADRRP